MVRFLIFLSVAILGLLVLSSATANFDQPKIYINAFELKVEPKTQKTLEAPCEPRYNAQAGGYHYPGKLEVKGSYPGYNLGEALSRVFYPPRKWVVEVNNPTRKTQLITLYVNCRFMGF
jgi:hypothetical protein